MCLWQVLLAQFQKSEPQRNWIAWPASLSITGSGVWTLGPTMVVLFCGSLRGRTLQNEVSLRRVGWEWVLGLMVAWMIWILGAQLVLFGKNEEVWVTGRSVSLGTGFESPKTSVISSLLSLLPACIWGLNPQLLVLAPTAQCCLLPAACCLPTSTTID